jgi:hypothetical protein
VTPYARFTQCACGIRIAVAPWRLTGFRPERPAGTAIIRKWKKTDLKWKKTAGVT